MTSHKGEIKDPDVLFDLAWSSIEKSVGHENMVFPKEIIWLAGAPGSGKGTMSEYIMRERDIAAGPIEVSGLLKGERFQRLKDQVRHTQSLA